MLLNSSHNTTEYIVNCSWTFHNIFKF